MAMIDRLVKNAFNKEGFEMLLNFSQKHLSEDAFDVMQKGFRGEEDYIFNAKVIKKALKKNDILETSDMVKYIKKYDFDGMFSEALDNLNKPRSPGPRPEKPNINKKGKEEKPEKLLKRQLEHDDKQQAYEEAIVKYDETVTDIYNQLKNYNNPSISENKVTLSNYLKRKKNKNVRGYSATAEHNPTVSDGNGGTILREEAEKPYRNRKHKGNEYDADSVSSEIDKTKTQEEIVAETQAEYKRRHKAQNQERYNKSKERREYEAKQKAERKAKRQKEAREKDAEMSNRVNKEHGGKKGEKQREKYIENQRIEQFEDEKERGVVGMTFHTLGEGIKGLFGVQKVRTDASGAVINELGARTTIRRNLNAFNEYQAKNGAALISSRDFNNQYGLLRDDLLGDFTQNIGSIGESNFDGIAAWAKEKPLHAAGVIAATGVGAAGLYNVFSDRKGY